MYKVIEVDGHIHQAVTNPKGEIRYFQFKEAAYNWISKHSYAGMSFKYVIEEVEDD